VGVCLFLKCFLSFLFLLFIGVDSKVKAAFTRAYNKDSYMTPYACSTISKKSRGAAKGEEEGFGDEEDEENGAGSEDEGENAEDVTKDAMIKVKAKSTTSKGNKAASASADTATKPKKERAPAGSGAGRGRGRGGGRKKAD
jgi:replication factor C subunit 1